MNSYADELLMERNGERTKSRIWLECFICQTPPTYETCRDFLTEKGFVLSRTDYEDVCKRMARQPQYK